MTEKSSCSKPHDFQAKRIFSLSPQNHTLYAYAYAKTRIIHVQKHLMR